MSRIGLVVIVGWLAMPLLLACGDKNAPLSPGASGGSGGGGGAAGRDGGAVSFALDIMPLLQRSCSCHVSGSTAPALNNYASVKAEAAASNTAIQNDTMPIAAPLPDADKALFASWVNAGAPNN